MSIIINDFEIVTQTPDETTVTPTSDSAKESSQAPAPKDIHMIVKRQTDREIRVLAH